MYQNEKYFIESLENINHDNTEFFIELINRDNNHRHNNHNNEKNNNNEHFVALSDPLNDIYLNNVRFTKNWSGYTDVSADGAEISNDTTGYKSLMIAGNKTLNGTRNVSMWDNVTVNGELNVTNKLCIGNTCITSDVLSKIINSK